MKSLDEALETIYREAGTSEDMRRMTDNMHRHLPIAREVAENHNIQRIVMLLLEGAGTKPCSNPACEACLRFHGVALSCLINGIRIGLEMNSLDESILEKRIQVDVSRPIQVANDPKMPAELL